MPLTPARTISKRYSRLIVVAMSAYMVIIFAMHWWFHHRPPVGPLKYALALLPALPIIASIVLLALYLLKETDEFIRVRHAQALLIASGFTLSVTAAWGFLEMFAQAPHMNPFWVLPIFCFAWRGTGIVQGWRDRCGRGR